MTDVPLALGARRNAPERSTTGGARAVDKAVGSGRAAGRPRHNRRAVRLGRAAARTGLCPPRAPPRPEPGGGPGRTSPPRITRLTRMGIGDRTGHPLDPWDP